MTTPRTKPLKFCAALALIGGLAACATPAQDEQSGADDLFGAAPVEDVNDPIEPFNRYIFEVNLLADKMLLRPIAEMYRVGLPDVVQDSVRNFLDNFSSPVDFLNSLFQGDFSNAWNTFARFGINTTAGIGGLFDVAGGWGFDARNEDFGQTLGSWGAGEGPYLMLPLLGPSNPRDGVGFAVDRFLNPIEWYLAGVPFSGDGGVANSVPLALTGVNAVDSRSRNIEALDALEANSLDFYATVRSLYRQRRTAAINNGDLGALGDDAGAADEAPRP